MPSSPVVKIKPSQGLVELIERHGERVGPNPLAQARKILRPTKEAAMKRFLARSDRNEYGE